MRCLSPSSTARRVLVVAAALLALLAAACSPGAPSANEGYTLRVGATSVTGTPAGSLGWGDKNGTLQQALAGAGVAKIEYSFFQSGKDVVAALLSGAVDVAAVGDNPSLTAKGNGADLKLLSFDSINGDTWLIGAKNGPTTIEGLVGKSVTAPQGTIRDRAARQLIDVAGLSGKIEVKDVPTPESIAGLSSGSIDATMVGGTGAVELESRGFPVIDKTSLHNLGSVGTTVTTTAFAEQHPGFADAWRTGITTTNQHIRDHLNDYVAWVAQTDGVDVELVRKATDPETFNVEPFPAAGVQQFQAAYEFLVKDGAIKQPFDLATWAAVP